MKRLESWDIDMKPNDNVLKLAVPADLSETSLEEACDMIIEAIEGTRFPNNSFLGFPRLDGVLTVSYWGSTEALRLMELTKMLEVEIKRNLLADEWYYTSHGKTVWSPGA